MACDLDFCTEGQTIRPKMFRVSYRVVIQVTRKQSDAIEKRVFFLKKSREISATSLNVCVAATSEIRETVISEYNNSKGFWLLLT